MERIVERKLARDLERRNILSPRSRRTQSRKKHLGKRSQIPEVGTNSGRGGRSGRCVQQSAVQTADGTPCAIWRQLDAHKMARSSTPGKVAMRFGNWTFMPQQLTMGLPQGFPLSPDLYKVYTKGLADLNSNYLNWLLFYVCGRRAYIQNSQ